MRFRSLPAHYFQVLTASPKHATTLVPARYRQGGLSSIDLARYLEYPELAEWLKTARTRRNWAEACSLGRATTGALACATFWHAHVGERLCAPGRKWAESDRAAFEKEFNGHGE